MYAWLNLSPDKTAEGLTASWYRLPTGQAAALSSNHVRATVQQIGQVIESSCPGLGPAERTRLRKEAEAIAPFLTCDGEVRNFVIHMYLAHLRLPPEARRTRERSVEEAIQMYFGAVERPPAWLTPCLQKVRVGALLVPMHWMPLYLRTECAQHWRTLTTEDAILKRPTAAAADLVRLTTAMTAGPKEDAMALLTAVFGAYSVCPPDARAGLVELVEEMQGTGRTDLLRVAVTAHNTVPEPRESGMVLLGLVDMLRGLKLNAMLPDGDALPAEDIVEAVMARVLAQRAAIQQLNVFDTTLALRSGVPMGPLGEQSRQALLELARQHNGVDQRITPDRLRATARLQPGVTAADAAPTEAAADLDPVHAWSVTRLLKWIEGPLATRTGDAARRIDRPRMAARNPTAGKNQGPRSRAADPNPRNTADRERMFESFTEADVDLVVGDALAATARFFLDDIDELLPLATALGAPPETIDACDRLRQPLSLLLEPGMDDDTARQQLGQAEDAIRALRARIRVAQVAQQKQTRFDARLNAALKAEPLELGKRHGGVIACPMAPADWPWVAEAYHGRWLPHARALTIDGTSVALLPDQALALYVTGSSRSHHAFDISVHLWQRRPDRDSPPARGEGIRPPMNTDDWFDTYLPCCVLHVPQGDGH